MNTTEHSSKGTGEPRLGAIASWAVLGASFGLSAATWVALAELAGFTQTWTLPEQSITLALAWLMPVAVDGYVIVALVLWMAPVPEKVAQFAKWNTYGAASIGIVAQSAYHLLDTLSATNEAWRVVLAAVVGALPPTVAGLAVHMRALIRRESGAAQATEAVGVAQVEQQAGLRSSDNPPLSMVPQLRFEAEQAKVSTPGRDLAISPGHAQAARFAMNNHYSTHGEPIDADQLASVMNVQPDVAARILAAATVSPNGHVPSYGGPR